MSPRNKSSQPEKKKKRSRKPTDGGKFKVGHPPKDRGAVTRVDDDQPWKKIPKRRGNPLFDKPVIPKHLLEKHSRGKGVGEAPVQGIVSKAFKKKTLTNEKKIQWSEEIAARTEVLLTEQAGFLKASAGEVTKQYTQSQIAANVDITSATKYFELNLDFGPYRVDYTRNGRHLLIGGQRGHIGAFDWVTKKLHCEINVMEEIKDVQWLHIETMFAVAQKNWVYIYDKQGVELHCLQKLKNILRMTFLPYHFLLVAASGDSEISWLDVSIGEMVRTTSVKRGRLGVMSHNPYNAVVCLGHRNGTVSMWSPNTKKPLVKMLCHKAAVETLSIDHTGTYMATSSATRELRIWDIRKFDGPIHSYELRGVPIDTSFSMRDSLALGFNNVVEVYKDWKSVNKNRPYLIHEMVGMVENIEFCPYEDVLGIGNKTGFTSILVPGAGEPNFDALEVNPLQTKTQRREAEVKSLLDKIQPEMIVLEPNSLLEVNVPGLKERIKGKMEVMLTRPPDIDFTPRNKKRGNTARKARVKKIVKQDLKKAAIQQLSEARKQIIQESGTQEPTQRKSQGFGALDRFLSKNKKNVKSSPSQPKRRGVK